MKCFGLVLLLAIFAQVKCDDKLTSLWNLRSESLSRTAPERNNVVQFVRRAKLDTSNTWIPNNSPVGNPSEPQTQMERTVRNNRNEYGDNKGKTEILFPGNYFPIADVKAKDDKDAAFNQFDRSSEEFRPKEIPLNRGYYGRSADAEVGTQMGPVKRSISYFDDEADEDYDETEDDDALEESDDDLGKKKSKKHKIKKYFKHAKYMLPLLLAYKLKFFTLIPLLKGLLVLLTGSTGLAGFFFALFAAVIGLKSGNW